MQTKVFQLQTCEPLHARPAAAILKCAKEYNCELEIFHENRWQLAGVINLLLAGSKGKESGIELKVTGAEEKKCLKQIGEILSARK
jgi:phosphotransferase system HPr (HPr) family protein